MDRKRPIYCEHERSECFGCAPSAGPRKHNGCAHTYYCDCAAIQEFLRRLDADGVDSAVAWREAGGYSEYIVRNQ